MSDKKHKSHPHSGGSKTKLKQTSKRKADSESRLTGIEKFTVPVGFTIYQFSVRTLQGLEVSLTRYTGFPLIIVNIASADSILSEKNITELNKLYENYSKFGFSIAAFPNNDFGCEPLNNEQIIKWVEEKKIKFDVYAKVTLSGIGASPLFCWLKKEKTGILLIDAIKYNFTKFLIDKHGIPYQRYSPLCNPASLEDDIRSLLN